MPKEPNIEKLLKIKCRGTQKGGGICERHLGYHDAATVGATTGHYCRDCKTTTESRTKNYAIVVQRVFSGFFEKDFDPAITVSIETNRRK